jgi:hypothetical protein
MEKGSKNIIIETSADLFKLPLDVIKKTPLYQFKGKYFQKLYEEALKIERSGGQIEINTPIEPVIENIQFEINYNTKVILIHLVRTRGMRYRRYSISRQLVDS